MVSKRYIFLQQKEFESDMKTSWKNFQMEKDFCDVTLACAATQIEVHKVVLSSSSSIFKDILKHNSHQNPLIYIRGVKYVDFINLVNFMYQGEVNIAKEDLNSFLIVADDLKIRGINQNHKEMENTNSNTEINSTIKINTKKNPVDDFNKEHYPA